MWDQLEPSQDRKTAEGKAWYSEGLLQSAEMVPAIIDGLVASSKQAAGWLPLPLVLPLWVDNLVRRSPFQRK
jgi:hypothetical protein